ncbi:MAG: DUF1343 domain-containing protein, partial [Negativicutes bacterium]|nr:DUF1343 domain-containing protein [Negativicutes bacterium]
AMEAAGENGLEVVVFDRPNPLGGLVCEGIVQQTGYQSFVGIKPMPVRYGLTIGELAGYLNSKYHLNCRLTVVPMKNWRRSMLWDDTGLPWLPTSPNMPSWHTALIYAGTCLLEGTNVSEGRGTTSPFRFFGAPDLNNNMVVNKLNRLQLPGVKFRPVWFTPQTDKYAGQVCAGVDLVVTSESQFRSWLTGVAILQCLIESYSSFTIERKVDFSGAHSLFESQLGMRWESIYTTDWQDLAAISDEDCRKWADESKIYWIYREI